MTAAKYGRQWPALDVHFETMVTGADLRRARRARRLTLAQCAVTLGVSTRTLGRWEASEELPDVALPVVEGFLGVDDPSPTIKMATEAELAIELLARIEARNRAAAQQSNESVAKTETTEITENPGLTEKSQQAGRVLIHRGSGVTLSTPSDDERQHGT